MTWLVRAKHSQVRRDNEPAVPDLSGVSRETVAEACNADPRFSAAAGAETADSISALMDTDAFSLALKRISSTNVPAHLATLVSAVYACRVEEKRLPKRPAKMR